MEIGRQPAVRITRTFNARPQQVFAAFANPALMKQWAAPREHRNERVDVDFRPGGRYRREMRFPDGSLHVLSGTYREIDPPRRLLYTFVWETIPELGETLVTVEFRSVGELTEVTVVHEGLIEEARGDHEAGWNDSFDRLAKLLHRA